MGIDIKIKTQNWGFIEEFLEVEEIPEKNTKIDIIEGVSVIYHNHKKLDESIPEAEDWPGYKDKIEGIEMDFSIDLEDTDVVSEVSGWFHEKLEDQEPIPYLEIEKEDTVIIKKEIEKN